LQLTGVTFKNVIAVCAYSDLLIGIATAHIRLAPRG